MNAPARSSRYAPTAAVVSAATSEPAAASAAVTPRLTGRPLRSHPPALHARNRFAERRKCGLTTREQPVGILRVEEHVGIDPVALIEVQSKTGEVLQFEIAV